MKNIKHIIFIGTALGSLLLAIGYVSAQTPTPNEP